MTIDKAVTRRGMLVAGVGGAGALALAACSSSSSDKSADRSAASAGASQDVVSPPASTSAPAAAGSSSAAPSSTAASSTAASSAAGASKDALVTLDDIAVGTSKAVKLSDGKPAIVTRTGTATAVCFSAICTHQGCTVAPKGKQFDCPCHGSTYDSTTGKVLGGPAPKPLPKIDITITDGSVSES